jgi:hypothetical protein
MDQLRTNNKSSSLMKLSCSQQWRKTSTTKAEQPPRRRRSQYLLLNSLTGDAGEGRSVLFVRLISNMKKNLPGIGLLLAAVSLVAMPAAILAQERDADAAPSIRVEMNGMLQLDEACQLTFMLTNGLDADVMSLVFETVLLTKDGAVDRLTLFDMRDLPTGIPRVRQFNVPSLSCDALGQVLINDVAECSGTDIELAACTNALGYVSRIDVEVLG